MNWQYMFCYMTVDVLCLAIGLIISRMVRSDSGTETQLYYLRALLKSYYLFVVSDMAWAVLIIGHYVPMDSVPVLALNAITRIAAALAGYYWFCFGELHLGRTFLYRQSARLISLIPMAVALVLYAVGLAMGATFVQLGDGMLGNGPLYGVITIVAMLYLVIVTVDSLLHARRTPLRSQRQKYLTFASFAIAPMVACIVDMMVPDMPVMSPAMLISIMLVLRQLQDSRVSIDALTGLNNRRRADAYLEENLPRVTPDAPLCLYVMDMDRFKDINDTYGHLEGDRALQTVADALREVSSELDAFAARWGGDEFVMICTRGEGCDPERAIRSIDEHLASQARAHEAKYTLSCSVGYAVCKDPSIDARAFFQEADRMLYSKKQQRHAR